MKKHSSFPLAVIRWTVLSLIVGISFGTVLALAESSEAEQKSAIFIDTEVISLKDRVEELRRARGKMKPVAREEQKCSIPADIPAELESVMNEAMEDIPCYLLQSLRRIEIFEDATQTLPRAMANARIIKVRKDAINDPEIVSVLIHELGHVVDLGGLTSEKQETLSDFRDGSLLFYTDDLSVKYYSISWTAENRKTESSLDFVGGYGKYDMFEDFAESFLLYIEHGNYFKSLTYNNEALRKKYLFFKKHVFNGQEFTTGSVPENLLTREWDITKL